MGEPEFIRKKIAERDAAKNAPKGMSERTKALVAAKHDTDSGMTPEQRRTVLEQEEKYRDRFTETGMIIGENGKVLYTTKKGSSNSAEFENGVLKLYGKDAVITHNHPDHEYKSNGKYSGQGKGMGVRVGTAISGDDLNVASIADAKEIRAASANYTYSVRRGKDGWGADGKTLRNEWYREYERQVIMLKGHANRAFTWRTYEVKDKEGNKQYYDGRRIHNERWGRMNGLASHRALKAVAKKYGLTYTRVKRHERSQADIKNEAKNKER